MANDDLKNKWQPVIRWIPEFREAQKKVLAETSVFVPLDRMCAHCGLETGYTGNPRSISGSNVDCNCNGQCAPDCRYHGLFQIFWPPFSGTDWSKIEDPAYNSYLGAKVLAYRYNQCGRNWTNASVSFFAGNCQITGTTDANTGTTDKEYIDTINNNIAELNSLGISSETGEPTNPKPKTDSENGGANTSTEIPSNCRIIPIINQQVCMPSLDESVIAPYFQRGILSILGIIVLIIGIWFIARG
jgi:hypothetical protein